MEYACFISYRHLHDEMAQKSVQALIDQIRHEIGLNIPGKNKCFVDEQGISVGQSIDARIPAALCASACMIVIFTPHYLDTDESLYCAKEYFAMKELEQQRMTADPETNIKTNKLIVTIVLRGEEDLPAAFRDSKFLDFSSFASVDVFGENSNTNYLTQLKEVSAYIKERYKTLSNSKISNPDEECCLDCSSFALPEDDRVLDWLRSISDESPRTSSTTLR